MMSDGSASATEPAGPEGAEPAGQSGGQVNVEQLADKVYRLLMTEIRLGRARGESVGGGRG